MAEFGELLWEPSPDRVNAANITHFTRWLAHRESVRFAGYHALWQWSVSESEKFWRAVWDYFEVGPPVESAAVLASREMPGARWFPGAQVNFSAHLLRQGEDERIALISLSESSPAREMSWAQLRRQVAAVASSLRGMGVSPGDRVAAYLPTGPEAVVAMLASIGIGAVWSCCSPDFGAKSVLDRFQQIAPSVLIAVDGYRYGGREFDRREVVRDLVARLPSLQQVIQVPALRESMELGREIARTDWSSIVQPQTSPEPIEFPALPFDHPLWVVFSSGTTGLPKAIVHGHGGTLVELLKATSLHMDWKRDSRIFFFTTTGWIVFPYLVSALLQGATIVLYDGNPAYPDSAALWRMAAEQRVTHFGTSPSFVSLMSMHGISPRREFDFPDLECVMCTGSPLTPESFAWIYDNVRRDLWVCSVSGGTDVVSGLVGGVPTLPVHNGEIQARCLGIPVEAWDDEGHAVIGVDGELVITGPIPSMPIGFWNDPDGARYRESYFDLYPGVWRHGDQLRITKRGSCIISGRSDATLNRHGVRIGTSEIYRSVNLVEGILDSLVVNLELAGGRFFMPLFVELAPGTVMDDALEQEIATRLRRDCSPRHVPDRIYAVDSIPYTITGKKMEVPIKKILMGRDPDKAANRDIMRNPESLDYFVRFAAEQRDYPS